jgi:hypothetical protein
MPAVTGMTIYSFSSEGGVSMKNRWLWGNAAITAVVLFGVVWPAGAFNLPDSDQRKCYEAVDPWAEIPCPGTGQDGAYVINPLSYTDNGDGTVTDNNTGLEWQQEDDNTTYNWYQASGTYQVVHNPTTASVCGSLPLGGHSDWRLPSKKELMSIVDYAIPFPEPTIATGYFPNTNASVYWSSTTHAYYPDDTWSAGFYGGDVGYSYKYLTGYVRCVRGGQSPGPSLTDNGNGTVTDSRTGLTWQQGEPGSMTWGTALGYCEGLEFPLGGATDWRLPNVKELESLTDDTRYHPAIDTTFFPDTIASGYWSSTTRKSIPYYAWLVSFTSGSVNASGNKVTTYYVRCVRGGQYGAITFIDTFADGTMAGDPEWTKLQGTWKVKTPVWNGNPLYASVATARSMSVVKDLPVSAARIQARFRIGATNLLRNVGFIFDVKNAAQYRVIMIKQTPTGAWKMIAKQKGSFDGDVTRIKGSAVLPGFNPKVMHDIDLGIHANGRTTVSLDGASILDVKFGAGGTGSVGVKADLTTFFVDDYTVYDTP